MAMDIINEDLLKKHPHDIAETIGGLKKTQEQTLAFVLLPKDLKGEVFTHFERDTQELILKSLGDVQLADMFEEMSPDDRTEVFEDFPDELIKDVINLLSTKERKIALTLIGYQENSVGRIMTPYYVQVKKDWTVQYTLEHIKKFGSKAETLDFIYVVDDDNKLIDDIKIGKLLLSESETLIEDLEDHEFVALKAKQHKEEAIVLFDDYDRSALPVVSDSGVLVGIVTFDDIMDEVEKRDTEDIQKMAAVEALELPYVKTPILEMVQKRGVWLIFLFFGELLTTTALASFESQIQQVVVLTLFIPLIIASGGNTGAQSTTLIIRAMALREISLKDWGYVLKKEIFSGALLGLILGTIGFAKIAIWHSLGFYDYGEFWLYIGYTVGIALVGVVLWGSITGAMIPFLLKKLRLDPATSSAPFVATLVDVTGLVLYFSIAMHLLEGKLL